MNTFYEHHENSIRFGYRCFDRILINGLIQPFQQPERVVGFFNSYRQLYPVSQAVLTDIATQYQRWVIARAAQWGTPIVEAPAGRRDTFVEPYFRRAKPDQVVVSGATSLCASAPTSPSRLACASTNITGSPRACRRRACGFARSPMRS